MRSVKQIEVKGARPRRGLQTVAVAWKQGKDWIGAASGEDTAQEPARGHRATVGGDKLMVQRHSGRWSRAGNSGPHWERTRPEIKIDQGSKRLGSATTLFHKLYISIQRYFIL